SDASVDGSRVSAATQWAATTTAKHAIQRAVSVRSNRNSWSATLMGSLRCRCGGRIALDEIAADHGQDLDTGIGIERPILRDRAREHVVDDDRRYGGGEPEGGGEQRLGDARRDHCEVGG